MTNDAASHAVDVVRVYAARGSAGNANQTTGSPTNGGDPGAVNVGGNEQTWWLKDINGYIPVTYCVDIYGPFTTRQDSTQTPSGAQLAVRPTAEMGLDGDYTKCYRTFPNEMRFRRIEGRFYAEKSFRLVFLSKSRVNSRTRCVFGIC